MKIAGKVVAITGAGGGIGRALALEAKTRGARAIAVSDLDSTAAEATAGDCGGRAWTVDSGSGQDIGSFVASVERELGPVDLYCSNAGIHVPGGADTPGADWERCWNVNVMAHVHAMGRLAPAMAARGGGHVLITVSAAGLLSQVGSATYATTKHAAMGFAEWLSITWGERGIGVSALCPQAVRTPMIRGLENGGVAGLDGVLEPEDVARAAFDGILRGDFLILPHPRVSEYVLRKATDPERWLRGMRRLQAEFGES